jgi:hypothetical protein
MAIGKVVIASADTDSEACVGKNAFLKLCGWSVSEDSGSTAEIKIYDGLTIATGTLAVAPIHCAAYGFGQWGISNQGIPCPNGITVERVSGTSTVILYVDRT